jgi:hypothetical protein
MVTGGPPLTGSVRRFRKALRRTIVTTKGEKENVTVASALFAVMLLAYSIAHADFQKAVDAVKKGDYAAAYPEFLKSADQGNPVALYNLGWMCEQGQGVDKDIAAAIQWYERAAKAENPRAQYRLGFLVENGIGQPVDVDKAIKWYLRASANGNNAAGQALFRLGVTGSPNPAPNAPGTGFRMNDIGSLTFKGNETDGKVEVDRVKDAHILSNISAVIRDAPLWEKVAIFAFGVIFIITLLLIALHLTDPTPFQYTIFRIVLALSAAAVATLISGFLQVQWSNYIKAGGALAVFVTVYFWSPAAIRSPVKRSRKVSTK